MPPATNRELRKTVTMFKALSEMSEGAQFTFNDRARNLEVVETSGSELVAESNRGKQHRFLWGGGRDHPKHKPRPNQTNNVKSLTVEAYGLTSSGPVSDRELKAIIRAHSSSMRSEPHKGLAHWNTMREDIAERLGISESRATDLVRRAQHHNQLTVVSSKHGIRADDSFPNSKPYVRLEFNE